MQMKKLKIVVFVPSLGRGGAEQSILRLTKNFIKKGHEVFLISAKKVSNEQSIPDNIEVQYLNKKRTLFSLSIFKKRLINIQPDIVLSTLPTSNFLNTLISKSKKLKYRAYIREANTNCILWNKSLSGWIVGILSRYAFRNAYGIIYISRELKEITTQAVGNPVNNSVTIYNPIITEDFLEKSNQKIDHPSYDPEKEIWVVGSRLEKQKGIDLLVDAVKKFNESRDLVLYILGSGAEKSRLEKKSKGLPIVYLDYIENPLPWYKAADLFFLPSYREGLGNSLIEAQILGTTSIASGCPSGPKEIISLFNNGVNFITGDLEDLISKIQSINVATNKKIDTNKSIYFDEVEISNKYLDFFTSSNK